MTIYERFCKLNLDRSLIELEAGSEHSDYFCTPVGATVIGWAGVDGIHFCFVEGFGEMVFAVSPMNAPGHFVRPVARSFEDFLRLVLACRGTAAIEQAQLWSKSQFDAYVSSVNADIPTQVVLASVSDEFSLEAMEDPYGYIRQLQQEFDYSWLEFPEDYEEWAPPVPAAAEWRVTFQGSFDRQDGPGGKEISIGKTFSWAGSQWHISAVYACQEGLVIDYLVRIDKEKVKEYIDKVFELEEQGALSREALEGLDPFDLDFSSTVVINGSVLRRDQSCGRNHIPVGMVPEEYGRDATARVVLLHYGVDLQEPWLIHRASYRWATEKKPSIRKLAVTLVKAPASIPGACFEISNAGDAAHFAHPVTGQSHTLTAISFSPESLNGKVAEAFPGARLPNHFFSMEYTISPPLPMGSFTLRDTREDDGLLYNSYGDDEARAIGFIGGEDGPTAVFLAAPRGAKGLTARSALLHEPAQKVRWQIVFQEKLTEDITVQLK